MQQSVVLLEKDPLMAHALAGKLRSHFDSIHVTSSRDELRDHLVKHSPEAVIFNIESWRLTDVESLHRDFPALPIVCTHRVPDEEMWMAALDAGASDVCPVDDGSVVLSAVLRSLAVSHMA